MNKDNKNKIIKKVEELYGEQRHDDIIDMLISLDVREDRELALLLVRAFIDVSESGDDKLLDSAELLLMQFPEISSDPRMIYQQARIYYYKERYCEAYRELLSAKKLAEEGKPFPERGDAEELLELTKSEYDKVMNVNYSSRDRYTLLEHISRHFGRIDKLITQTDNTSFKVEIAEVLPDTEAGRDHYTLVTIGIGAHEMNVPKPFADMVPKRSELIMYLPPDMDEDMRKWAVGYMCTIGRIPIERNSWSSYGHIFSNGRPIMDGTELCACTLIEVQDADENAAKCDLLNGVTIMFYQLFPMYKEEVEFKMEHGLGELVEKMPHISAVLDLKRENVCESRKKEDKKEKGESVKESPLLAKEIDYVSELDVGELCAASRLIVEKGLRVGYMRRFLLEREDGPDLHGDSGWLFMSGMESGDFLSDPMNIKICRLNTICNIDSEIVPFLTEPFNTIVARGTDGRLHIEPSEPTEDLLS